MQIQVAQLSSDDRSNQSSSASTADTTKLSFSMLSENLLLRAMTHRVMNDWFSTMAAVCQRDRRYLVPDAIPVVRNVASHLFRQAELMCALQVPNGSSTVDAGNYLGQICRLLSRTKLEPRNIHLRFAADTLQIEAARCWRLGMIVCELVTNSARHAFLPERNGTIRVDLCRADPFAVCQVSDNGTTPAQVRPGNGLKIVEELVRSLDGQIEQQFGRQGSTSILSFVA